MKLLLSKAVSQKMKNREYWQKRFEELEDRRMKEAAAYYRDVEKQFRRAQNRIEKDIERWYQRLADNQGISYAAAKRLLNKKELAEFQWTLEEYIKKGKENAISPRWLKELENASAKIHITHLEGMKTAIQQYNEVLFAQLKEGLTGHLSKVAQESFYRNAYEIAKGTGIGRTVPYFDSKKLEIILNQTWAADGTKFSDRIWKNKQKLVGKLHTELTQSIIRGEAPDKAIQRLAKEMKVSEKQTGRLIMTETAAISSAADLKSYQELGIKKYQILATLDNKTSLICQDMDHKVFDIKDYQVGMTAPPFHPYCRTTTIPYFEDEFTIGEQRAAKDEETGKTYYVPAGMSYQEWKESFIGDEINKKQIISKINNVRDVWTRNKPPISLQDLETMYGYSISKTISKAPILFEQIIFDNIDKIVFAKTNARGHARYSIKYGIFINLDKDCLDKRGQWTALFHEIGHNLDEVYGRPSESTMFINALKNDFFTLTNNYMMIYNMNIEQTYEDISCYLRKGLDEQVHIISDLFGALSGGKCKGKWGHKKQYWESRGDKGIGSEAFAHFFSASIINDEIKLESIKETFPTGYEEFLKMVGDMR